MGGLLFLEGNFSFSLQSHPLSLFWYFLFGVSPTLRQGILIGPVQTVKGLGKLGTANPDFALLMQEAEGSSPHWMGVGKQAAENPSLGGCGRLDCA